MLLAVWTAKYVNTLPDSAFLYVERGGKKDNEAKTVPRSKRHFPYRDAKGKIDLAHLRNAIARIPQSNIPQNLKQSLQQKARKLLESVKNKAAGHAALLYEGEKALDIGEGTASEEVTTRRFRKDMIKVGTYTHPIHGWQLDVTEARLYRWLAAFRAMRAKGIDVEVPLDHSRSAADNLGYIIDASVEPDQDGVLTMFGVIEARGEGAIDIVRRNRNVSVFITLDYIDGKGNSFGEAIQHCSIVAQPIVPGQSDFVAIAASRAAEDERIPVFVLSKGTEMNEEMLTKIREMLGAGDDLTEENALSRIEERFKKLSSDLQESQDELITATGKIEQLQSKTKKAASHLDPNTLELLARRTEDLAASCVEHGAITPNVRDKLLPVLVGQAGKRREFALSVTDGDTDSLAGQVFEILRQNDATELKEKTKGQTLSRTLPGAEDDPVGPDEASGNAMLEAVPVAGE